MKNSVKIRQNYASSAVTEVVVNDICRPGVRIQWKILVLKTSGTAFSGPTKDGKYRVYFILNGIALKATLCRISIKANQIQRFRIVDRWEAEEKKIIKQEIQLSTGD